jgi:hypothetical protein
MPSPKAAALSHCDRLEIWKAVHLASTYAKQASAIIKHETRSDDYDLIYLRQITPTLQRYGLDRLQAFLIYEEEGGWPYDPALGSNLNQIRP